MQPQRMQKRRQPLHHTQNSQRQDKPHPKHPHRENDPDHPGHPERSLQGHVIKHFGELGVREREGPESEVGGRVGDTAEAEFDGMDDLVDDDVAHLKGLAKGDGRMLAY